MKVGIVGLPNVGKSTLFKALTKHPVDINNYPFCTISPNVGVVEVPDERLDQLSVLSSSAKKITAIVEFVDIAGLVKGASEGEGLGNQFLAHIREVDVIVQVVRVFLNSQVVHVYDTIDPVRDIEVVNTELILADMQTVQKRLQKLEKESRSGDKEKLRKRKLVSSIASYLSAGRPAREASLSQEECEKVSDLQLLTWKPILYVYNIADFDEKLPEKLEKPPHVKVDIKIEEELGEMQKEELDELNMKTGLHELVKKSFELLKLITFFTTGPKETRAWRVKQGSRASEAGRAIHSDFCEKFIRADVINWKELIEIGSWPKAREQGKLRTEGKDYIVQDGDVVEFKI